MYVHQHVRSTCSSQQQAAVTHFGTHLVTQCYVCLLQVTGAENAEFVRFSGAALQSAQQKLSAFLACMPAAELAAAKEQLALQ